MRRLFHLQKTYLEPRDRKMHNTKLFIWYLRKDLTQRERREREEKGKIYTDPDFLSKISAHHQLGDAARWSEGQSIVSPFLTEIEIGREVL